MVTTMPRLGAGPRLVTRQEKVTVWPIAASVREGVCRTSRSASFNGTNRSVLMTITWPSLVRKASRRGPPRTRFAGVPRTPGTRAAHHGSRVRGSKAVSNQELPFEFR